MTEIDYCPCNVSSCQGIDAGSDDCQLHRTGGPTAYEVENELMHPECAEAADLLGLGRWLFGLQPWREASERTGDKFPELTCMVCSEDIEEV